MNQFSESPRPDLKDYGQLVGMGLAPVFSEPDKRAGRVTPQKPPHNDVQYRSQSGMTKARVLSTIENATGQIRHTWEVWHRPEGGANKKVFTCNAYDPEAIQKIKQTFEIYEP